MVKKLSKIKELIESIKQDKNVIRFKELENIIDADESLKSEYMKLIDFQKIMVQHEAKNSVKLGESKLQYNKQLDKVMNHLLMGEYLDVLEVVNNDLQMIKRIILNEISVDFE